MSRQLIPPPKRMDTVPLRPNPGRSIINPVKRIRWLIIDSHRFWNLPGRTWNTIYYQKSSGFVAEPPFGPKYPILSEIPIYADHIPLEDIELTLTPASIRKMIDLDPLMPNAHYRHYKIDPAKWFKTTPVGQLDPEEAKTIIATMDLEEFIAIGCISEEWAQALTPLQKPMKERLKHENAMTCWRLQRIHVLAALLQNGMGLDGKDSRTERTLLFPICYHGHLQALKHCLDANCGLETTDINGYTPLQAAVAGGQIHIVTELLRHKVEVDHRTNEGFSALFQSVALWTVSREPKHLTIAAMLIGAGANIHLKTNHQDTPVRLAARNQDTHKVLLLLTKDHSKQFGIEYVESDGFTLLMLAAQYGAWHCVRYLLQQEVDVNRKTMHGDTAITFAAKYAQHAIMALLLEFWADVNLVNANGQTPLFATAHEGGAVATEILLHAGADTNLTDGFGNSPICHAMASCGMNCRTLTLLANWPTTPQYAKDAAQFFLNNRPHILLGVGPRALPTELINAITRFRNPNPT